MQPFLSFMPPRLIDSLLYNIGVAKEPEPGNTGSTPSFSTEEQLRKFIEKLPPPEDPMITIPGFLFRDQHSRSFEPHFNPAGYTYYFFPDPARQRASVDKQLAHIDNDLLLQHAETYRRGLEARNQLLARIKPVKILELVRDIWGKGEIAQKEMGATVTYSYLAVKKEFGYSEPSSTAVGGRGFGIEYFKYDPGGRAETGKWIAGSTSISEEIHIDFGNAAHPSLPFNYNINDSQLDKFFADSNHTGTQSSALSLGDALFREIPKTIWRRPDNLGITVTIPRASLINDEEWKPENASRRIRSCYAWFDQSASQQEIMDFLTQKLEAQRTAGFLPSQIEAVEFAKIEELRKRGLFIEPTPRT